VVDEEEVALTIEEVEVAEAGEEAALMIAAEDGLFPREEAFNKKEEAFNKKEEDINKKGEEVNKNQEVAGDVAFIVVDGDVFRIATRLRQQDKVVVVGTTKGEDEDVADFVEEGGISGLAAHP
jgi:hypothetical protein